jgi:hypothetical protein
VKNGIILPLYLGENALVYTFLENVKSKSLSAFINADHKQLSLRGVRCSMKSYRDQGWMENIPLFAVESFFLRLARS